MFMVLEAGSVNTYTITRKSMLDCQNLKSYLDYTVKDIKYSECIVKR